MLTKSTTAMSMTRLKWHDFQVPDVAIHYFRQSATDMLTMRSKQWVFPGPDVTRQVFRELTTRSDDQSTYHLEFWVDYSALVAWLGDEDWIY
jgi:hypothetical protein